MIENAATVFALNLYAFALTNPVAIMLACGSIYPSLDFYYDGTLSWWERYWRWVVLGIGVAATIIAVALAPFTCGASAGAGAAIATTLFNIAMGTVIGAATTLAIGGITAGISSALKGNGFWNGFAEYYASVNLADVLLTSFAFAAVGVMLSNVVGAFQCFKEGTLVATENGLKPIEEVKVGDKVLAYDEVTAEKAYKPVVRLFRNETLEWYHIFVNNDEIVCTGGHPFYVLNASEDRNAIRFDDGEETSGKCYFDNCEYGYATIQVRDLKSNPHKIKGNHSLGLYYGEGELTEEQLIQCLNEIFDKYLKPYYEQGKKYLKEIILKEDTLFGEGYYIERGAREKINKMFGLHTTPD